MAKKRTPEIGNPANNQPTPEEIAAREKAALARQAEHMAEEEARENFHQALGLSHAQLAKVGSVSVAAVEQLRDRWMELEKQARRNQDVEARIRAESRALVDGILTRLGHRVIEGIAIVNAAVHEVESNAYWKGQGDAREEQKAADAAAQTGVDLARMGSAR